MLDKLTVGYWDLQLPLLLKFGFPLNFLDKAQDLIISTEKNHASAEQFPRDISKYLSSEIGHRAFAGPFKGPPFSNTIQVSPFMSRHKPDSDNRRVIIDLSWSEKASVNHFSLNNVYLDTVFKLQYIQLLMP